MNASDYEIQKTLLQTSRFTLFRARNVRTGASVLLESFTEAGQQAFEATNAEAQAPAPASAPGSHPLASSTADHFSVGGRLHRLRHSPERRPWCKCHPYSLPLDHWSFLHSTHRFRRRHPVQS